MVNNTFVSLAEFSKSIFHNYISVPDVIARPILIVPYGSLIFVLILLFSFLISRFVGIKKTFYLLFFILVTSFLFGGFYFSVLMLLISIPLLFIVKIKKSEGEFGIEKEEKFDFGKEELGKEEEPKFEEELKIEEPEFGKEPELKGEISETMPSIEEKPQQKVCPYCGMTLIWVPQYQRYYCSRCRRYL